MPIAAIKSSLPRRLFVVTAVGALAAVALLVGPTRPANAAGCTANGSWATCYSDVTAIAGSSMTIFDDEWLETDEIGTFLTGMGIAFTPYVSSGTRVISKCAGGEVRVEFTLNAERSNADGTVRVGGIANLFEGTSCSSTDKDGWRSFGNITIKPGEVVTIPLRVDNLDEGWRLGQDQLEAQELVSDLEPRRAGARLRSVPTRPRRA